jgi:predicted DCC family thiol-disulfide oxidoreductase YuxK
MAATLVYDGDCGICDAGVRALRRIGCRAEMVPSQQWLRRHPEDAERCAEALLLVTDDGTVLEAELAVAEALRLSRRPASLAGAVIDAPGLRRLSARAYRRVAAGRSRLSARLGLVACALPERVDAPNTGGPLPSSR